MASLARLTECSAKISLLKLANRPLLNHTPSAGYKKRQTSELLHEPNFDEYDQLPGDRYQTTYVGYYDDERHTDPRALDRFYRLNWGGWIRARGGRGTGMWKKRASQMWWTKQHILCNETQSQMLEKMFAQKYRKKTYFVDDPYEIYEERETEFLPYGTRPYSYSYAKARDFVENN